MKNILVALILAGMTTFSYANGAASAPQKPETKKVCVDRIKDGKPVLDKQSKPVQDCKEIKIHKKLEGTKVEDAKKGK